jgi:hypothetical protein
VGDGNVASAAPGLATAFPNPIRERATIRFALQRAGRVTLTVHDALGRRVAVLADGPAGAGGHSIAWQRETPEGHRAASGIYFLRLVTEEGSTTRKVVLVE